MISTAWNALMRALQSYSHNCLLVTLLLHVQAARTLYRFSSKPDSSVPLQHICLIIQTMSITCIFHFYTTELFSLLKSRNPDRSVSANQNAQSDCGRRHSKTTRLQDHFSKEKKCEIEKDQRVNLTKIWPKSDFRLSKLATFWSCMASFRLKLNHAKHVFSKNLFIIIIINALVFSRLFYCLLVWSNTSSCNLHAVFLLLWFIN